ncbi:unnamed protein product [Arctogadus glacialis]
MRTSLSVYCYKQETVSGTASILSHPGKRNTSNSKERTAIFRQREPSNTVSDIRKPSECSEEAIQEMCKPPIGYNRDCFWDFHHQ